MNVLVVGHGAREHKLAAKVAESPLVDTLYVAPGNAGMETLHLARTGLLLKRVRIPASDVDSLCSFAERADIDLTVVGPELPLSLGIVDRFLEWDLPIVGPTKAAARLETSKVFAKRFMWKHNIPTARGTVAFNVDAALGYVHEYFRTVGTPLVVKADGLARGRGAFVSTSEEEAVRVVHALVVEGIRGRAGRAIVLEHFLDGEEISVHILTNGTDWWWLPVSQDYKRLSANPESSMTGGMGAISFASDCWNAGLAQQIVRSIIEPTLAGMRESRMPYRGVLYIGLMIVGGKPFVLEFNARFGDPEAQVVLSRVMGDIVPYLCHSASRVYGSERGLSSVGDVTRQQIAFSYRRCVCVVLASAGYPDAVKYSRHPIEGLEEVAAMPDVHVYHAGTVRGRGSDSRLYTFDGRVVSVVGEGETLGDATRCTYRAVDYISWPGMQYRRDIGLTREGGSEA